VTTTAPRCRWRFFELSGPTATNAPTTLDPAQRPSPVPATCPPTACGSDDPPVHRDSRAGCERRPAAAILPAPRRGAAEPVTRKSTLLHPRRQAPTASPQPFCCSAGPFTTTVQSNNGWFRPGAAPTPPRGAGCSAFPASVPPRAWRNLRAGPNRGVLVDVRIPGHLRGLQQRVRGAPRRRAASELARGLPQRPPPRGKADRSAKPCRWWRRTGSFSSLWVGNETGRPGVTAGGGGCRRIKRRMGRLLDGIVFSAASRHGGPAQSGPCGLAPSIAPRTRCCGDRCGRRSTCCWPPPRGGFAAGLSCASCSRAQGPRRSAAAARERASPCFRPLSALTGPGLLRFFFRWCPPGRTAPRNCHKVQPCRTTGALALFAMAVVCPRWRALFFFGVAKPAQITCLGSPSRWACAQTTTRLVRQWNRAAEAPCLQRGPGVLCIAPRTAGVLFGAAGRGPHRRRRRAVGAAGGPLSGVQRGRNTSGRHPREKQREMQHRRRNQR